MKACLLVMGLSGMVGQIVLIREFLISFLGNELTLGIVLANWLVLEAMGSYALGRTVERSGRRRELFVSLQLLFATALPSAVYLSRVFKNLMSFTPGEALGVGSIFAASFLILLPVAVPHGALFACGAKLYSELHRRDASAIGKVYLLETVGSLVGGFALTFLLVQTLGSFEICLAVSLMNAAASVFLFWPGDRLLAISFPRGLWGLSVLVTFALVSSFFLSVPGSLHLASIRSQWRNLEVVHSENSIYGNVTVTRRGEQLTFFTDGVACITTPVPEIVALEDVVHFPMLLHPAPKSVFVLGGGAGGMIREILKHPVGRVDYVELDPLLLRLLRRFPTSLTASELSDPRVKIHYLDGRLFVRRTAERFDLLFVGLNAPQTLQANRLFSAEFFETAAQRMNPHGIVVVTLPGSLTYLSPGLRDLNGCLLETLRRVYPSVRVIPGEVNLFLASNAAGLEAASAEEISRRLEARRIESSLFTKEYVEHRLQAHWLTWFRQSVGEKAFPVNSDFRPSGLFFSLSYWNSLFSPRLAAVFRQMEALNLGDIALGVFLVTLLLMGFGRIVRPGLKWPVLYAIFATGLAGMVLQLLIIFTFQSLYGCLYHQIGLLITFFMAGVMLGSLFVTRQLKRIQGDVRFFLVTEFVLVFFAFLLPFLFSMPSRHLEKAGIDLFLRGAFLMASLCSGAMMGLQFPLASRIYLGAGSLECSVGHAAGLLYAADLLGGFFGGLLGGVVFLPVLGLKESCWMVGMLKISSGALLLFLSRGGEGGPGTAS